MHITATYLILTILTQGGGMQIITKDFATTEECRKAQKKFEEHVAFLKIHYGNTRSMASCEEYKLPQTLPMRGGSK